MGGKKKKKGKGKGKKKGKKGKKGRKAKKGKKKSVGGKKGKGKCAIVRAPIDIMGPDAMENAYYMCHNAADCLRDRGFPWPMAKKGKKKK